MSEDSFDDEDNNEFDDISSNAAGFANNLEKHKPYITYFKKPILYQTIGELLLFFAGISLIILNVSGILILGTIGLVVCGAIVFSALSYFMGTYFGSKYYRCDDFTRYNIDNTNDEKHKVKKYVNDFLCWLKFAVLPIIFLGIGITLLALGITGGLGLGLALGFGVPSIALFAFSAVRFAICSGKITSIPDIGKEEKSRKAWIILMAIILSLAVATSLALGFLGILGWGSVLVFFIIPSTVIASAKILTKVISQVISGQRNFIYWLKHIARAEEISELVFFLGGITFSVLMTVGVLPFSFLGLGICAMLTIFGATRFFITNSWTTSNFDNLTSTGRISDSSNRNSSVSRQSKLASNLIYDVQSIKPDAIGFIKHKEYSDFLQIIKQIVVPIITGIAGITCTALGIYGPFGLSLGLGVGIPLILSTIVPGVFSLIKRIHQYIKKIHTEEARTGEPDENVRDNSWAICLSITAGLTAVTFSVLGATGILAWGTAIALAAPLVLVSLPFGCILIITRIMSKFKPDKKITVLGIGFCQENGFNGRKTTDIQLEKKDRDSIESSI